jgi:peptidoglycan/LPS O-acetylase OafA/YrhL
MKGAIKLFDSRLESLRGIAAFGVAWTHANIVFIISEPVNHPGFMLWRDWIFLGVPAGAAVVLFFVLSGFVLGASLQRDTNVVRFVVRRMFRIFPALWLAVAITYAAEVWLAPGFDRAQCSEWFQNVFLRPQTVADFFRNLVLAKVSIDPVAWSLVPEVLCSLMLPALVWLHQRTERIGRLAILGCLVVIGHYAEDKTLCYAMAFYAGFSLPAEVIGPRLTNWWLAAAAAIAGWLMLCLGNAYGVPYTPMMREVCTAGAVILISAMVAAPGSFSFLNARPLRFLGRVSFSFYLLHLPVLFLLTAATLALPAFRPHSIYGTVALAMASIVAAAAAAALSHRFVELPGIALGRRVSEFIARGLPFVSERPAMKTEATARAGP